MSRKLNSSTQKLISFASLFSISLMHTKEAFSLTPINSNSFPAGENQSVGKNNFVLKNSALQPAQIQEISDCKDRLGCLEDLRINIDSKSPKNTMIISNTSLSETELNTINSMAEKALKTPDASLLEINKSGVKLNDRFKPFLNDNSQGSVFKFKGPGVHSDEADSGSSEDDESGSSEQTEFSESTEASENSESSETSEDDESSSSEDTEGSEDSEQSEDSEGQEMSTNLEVSPVDPSNAAMRDLIRESLTNPTRNEAFGRPAGFDIRESVKNIRNGLEGK